MNKQESLLLGILIGATLMYILDPDRGRRRRALIRDRMVHGKHGVGELGGEVVSRARHMRNRAKGALIETRSRLRREEVEDPVLEGRVRAALGRLASDPSAIRVSAENGRVTLRGTAPETEVERIAERVQEIPGVHDVINRLEPQKNTA